MVLLNGPLNTLPEGVLNYCIFSGKPCHKGSGFRKCTHCGAYFFPDAGGLGDVGFVVDNDDVNDDVFCSKWCAGRNEVVQCQKKKLCPPDASST